MVRTTSALEMKGCDMSEKKTKQEQTEKTESRNLGFTSVPSVFSCPFFVFYGLVVVLASAQSAWADKPPPSSEELQALASRCRTILDKNIVKFYLPNCVDPTNGGYLETLRDGKFAPTGEKFLTLQGRQLWVFSTLVQENIDKETTLRAAKTGFEFLQKHLRAPKHDGYFSNVSD